ncbi:hypothetical protein E4Q23_17720 [Candidatus Accumulibacter phosphatis]|uniref:Uncharacterized protein n=1 Tax=Candidatus Accumulibacter phosphatis TaxID=327160 RepID=A0ABX1TYT9_9PROT|nr:hypothetical protein [Candidatus Accumulibacter phosphatis]NMQ29441.1 hypothetical protein [Candidatus Accumulibacter phosphatis]
MNLITGETRATLGSAEVARLKEAGALIEDPRRERPRYFDGRFLAARDLIRDQQYILTREADLGQAAGSGVASGLDVERGSAGDRVNVAAGHGVTAAGELVLLTRAIELRLADIPRAEQLSARFGLGRVAQPPLRNRSGLFVLALRPVEYTDNPIGSYPTSITGQRSVEDGDVVEATAIVLVPWQDDGAADALDARRGRAAAAIFAGDGARGLSANVLPLAMLALSNNVVVWVDEAMVRRELGADRADLPGLGYAPRALRLAHLVQHQVHLADLLLASGGRGFAARENFPLLPSAGPIPAGMIDSRDFTQRYFPPEMVVDFSIIPEDELPALVEEALSLPPIDLEAPSATLESTSILLLAPIPRNEWRAVSSRLTTRTRTLRPAAINLVATRKPLEILQQLRIPRLPLPIDSGDPSNAEWARLAALPDLWFVRRRNLAYRDDLAGEAIRLAGRDTLEPSTDSSRLSALGLDIASNRVFARATPRAALEVQSLLASPRFAESPSLTAAALGELGRAETLDQAAVLRVAADLSAPGVGDGLIRLERARPDSVASTAALAAIADGGDWRSADSAAAKLRSAELSRMAGTVLRPQPLNPSEPAVKPTLTTPTAAPTPTLIPRPPTRAGAATTRAAAQAAPAVDTPTAGEKAATTPSGKRRKASPAASTSEATGKAGGNRK